MSQFVILAPGAFDYIKNKTGNMLIRYREKEVRAVIDPQKAGKTAQEVLGFGGRIPVIGTFEEADSAADTLVVGNAPQGGLLSPFHRQEIEKGIKAGCRIINGMHQFLNDDQSLSALALKHNVKLSDLRKPPSPPHFPRGSWKHRKFPVLLIVGTDCDTGKMTTGWEICRQLNQRGRNVRFLGTGQTGILLSGNGVPIDAVVGDFMAGEIEYALDRMGGETDLVIVEGQGSLSSMLYAGVTLGLMHGAMPDYMIMTHEPTRTKDVSNYKMASIGTVMNMHLDLIKHFKDSVFLGINLLTFNLDKEAALKSILDTENEFNIPAADLVRFGAGDLINSIENAIFNKF
ncbi:MAG: DUF1611 domain-containing protein [Candidatus Neomarinimicrobiota bacterium]